MPFGNHKLGKFYICSNGIRILSKVEFRILHWGLCLFLVGILMSIEVVPIIYV